MLSNLVAQAELGSIQTHIDKRSSTNGFAFGALKVWRRGVETLLTVTRLYISIVLLKAGATGVVVDIAIVSGAPIRIGDKKDDARSSHWRP